MIPARLAPFLSGFLLSGMMSFLVSGVATYRALGFPSDFLTLWMAAWIPAWAVAFPTLLICRPFVFALVERLVRQP